MTAMAEVIDESIRNMTSNMVTKADQEKVSSGLSLLHDPQAHSGSSGSHSFYLLAY